MGTRYLHLVRHGQYHMDQKHPKYGSLTTIGRKQAKCSANRLKDYEVNCVYISTMTRARETAYIILQSLNAAAQRSCPLLVEGIPEFPRKLLKAKKVKKSSLAKTKSRMNRAFKKYFKPFKGKGERHEVLICHGNIIRYLVIKTLGVDTVKWLNFDILQCSISTVRIDDNGTPRLITFGEIGHVPTAKRTYI
jgi:serine/threonine-protein phosphatase PGAM5